MAASYYFSHDYSARSDTKIKKMLSKHGMEGYGIFWAIVESLYQNANALPTDYELIAYELRVDANVVQSVIEDFGLFSFDSENFGSISVELRLDKRNEKSKKASQSAFARWNKEKENANAMRTQCDSNAIKEKKGKEKKEIKEKKEKKEGADLIFPFDGSEFIEMWEQWKTYKDKEHGFKYKSLQSEQAALMKLSNLADGNEQAAIKIIMQSLENGWKGFFELKTHNSNGQKQTGSGFDLQRAFDKIDAMYDRQEARPGGGGDN